MAETYDYIFRLVLLGDSNVGKSAILHRFMQGSFAGTRPTRGM